ncbi:RidA family protein [Phyllobacterium sp. A18/5-2]|jgi:enamine deaminase RidA (YjgF/YER057c/UK114 family)|uniref:RidA family protein n=1 Tax=Phyllobacterium sp. A18/5-2 TaxID=2978392 RepID=UPI000DD80169|nr:RidA family protein [Phyllobacterium sp. A18/5-2]UXN63648.1 RidA family protein [Phyllobacterium sp. A18/5-2]
MQGERIFSGSPYEEKAGYARAAVAGGWIFVSGTTGFDAQTKEFPADVEAQCENCFRNIENALERAGATLKDLVRVQIFVTSQEEFERIIPIIRKHCYEARPANTTVFAQLVAPHMRVEVEAIAVAPSGK